MIETDNLKPGDKLPSERSLCERLDTGRSSVREALRALELLGLIETKKGEGTFLRDFKGHQLVELISTFILQDEKAKQDVLETKNYIQLNCLQIASQTMSVEQLNELSNCAVDEQISESKFFIEIVKIADNYLLSRLWTILNDYYHSLGYSKQYWAKEDYILLLQALKNKNEWEIGSIYKDIKKRYPSFIKYNYKQ